MRLKTCSCCKRELKTCEAKRIGKDSSLGAKMLYVNCKFCGSTLVLISRVKISMAG